MGRKFVLPAICAVCLLSNPAAGRVHWLFNSGGGDGLRRVEVPAGSGNFAIETWDYQCDWNTYFYTDQPFSRGDNLRCSFRWWWVPEADPVLNDYTAITGPWHSQPAGAVQPYSDSEVMIDNFIVDVQRQDTMSWSESGAVQSGPRFNTAFDTAVRSANSRATSILICVYLGDTGGGRAEWSTDNGYGCYR